MPKVFIVPNFLLKPAAATFLNTPFLPNFANFAPAAPAAPAFPPNIVDIVR